MENHFFICAADLQVEMRRERNSFVSPNQICPTYFPRLAMSGESPQLKHSINDSSTVSPSLLDVSSIIEADELPTIVTYSNYSLVQFDASLPDAPSTMRPARAGSRSSHRTERVPPKARFETTEADPVFQVEVIPHLVQPHKEV